MVIQRLLKKVYVNDLVSEMIVGMIIACMATESMKDEH